MQQSITYLGATDLKVSTFGLGCARLGGIFKRTPNEFVDLLSAALDAGISFFDTADIYSQGESETLLGRAFGRRRDKVVIASKVGYVLPAQRRLIARVKPLVRPLIRLAGLRRQQLPSVVRGTPAHDFSSAHLRRAVEGSLSRLQTDRLDLLQLHSPPADVIERGDVIDVLDALVREGKIRYYGISCDTVDAARAALRVPTVSTVQVVINLLEQSAVDEVLPIARRQDVGVIARECLANGLLVKPAASIDWSAYTQSPLEVDRRRAALESWRAIAVERGMSLPQLAMQYVSGLAGVSVSLLGVSSRQQLDDLIAFAAQTRAILQPS